MNRLCTATKFLLLCVLCAHGQHVSFFNVQHAVQQNSTLSDEIVKTSFLYCCTRMFLIHTRQALFHKILFYSQVGESCWRILHVGKNMSGHNTHACTVSSTSSFIYSGIYWTKWCCFCDCIALTNVSAFVLLLHYYLCIHTTNAAFYVATFRNLFIYAGK